MAAGCACEKAGQWQQAVGLGRDGGGIEAHWTHQALMQESVSCRAGISAWPEDGQYVAVGLVDLAAGLDSPNPARLLDL